MPLHLHCRYDHDGHGEFANAVALRQHYDRDHPEYSAPPPGQSAGTQQGKCSCGVSMQSGSFRAHWQRLHEGDPQYVWSSLRAAKVVKAPVTHPEAQRRPQRHVAPDPVAIGVDDIVIPAITAMAHPGGVVPVAHMAALFAWRDATAVMLRAVGHGR